MLHPEYLIINIYIKFAPVYMYIKIFFPQIHQGNCQAWTEKCHEVATQGSVCIDRQINVRQVAI